MFDASETVSLYFLATRVLTLAPALVFSEIAFAVTLPLNLPGGGGGGGGGGTLPTVKLPFICTGWASQRNVYVPSVNVTVHVTVTVPSRGVDMSTPGPRRWKL